MSLGQLICAAIVLSVLTTITNGLNGDFTQADIWFAIILLGVFGTAAPMVTIYLLIKRTGLSTTSLTTFFNPFVAVLIGVIFLAEPITPSLAIGFMRVP